MFLVYLAVVCSAMSFLTGIVIIGSGKEFQYNPSISYKDAATRSYTSG